MKCQYCNARDAANTFAVMTPAGVQEIHLCEECTRMAKYYYDQHMRTHSLGGGDESARRRVGQSPYPDKAGIEIRHRRSMNQLHALLDRAVQQERYEDAARLRDEIAEKEKDVYAV